MTLKDRSILDGDDVDSVLPHLTSSRPLRPALRHLVYERLRCATRPVGGPPLVSVLPSGPQGEDELENAALVEKQKLKRNQARHWHRHRHRHWHSMYVASTCSGL